MNINKILGYFLLLLGLIFIIWIVYYSYNIFSAKIDAPQVFKVASETKQSSLDSNNLQEKDIQQYIEMVTKQRLKDILPADLIIKLLNLIAWSIFAAIVILAGSKIGNLGINLIGKSKALTDK